IRPSTAESRITVDRVACFEPGDVCARLFHDARDIVPRNQRQMGAEFLCVFPAERERIGWIDAAGDHARERFIIRRLWSLHLLNFQYIGWPVLVRDHGPHRWLFVSSRYGD